MKRYLLFISLVAINSYAHAMGFPMTSNVYNQTRNLSVTLQDKPWESETVRKFLDNGALFSLNCDYDITKSFQEGIWKILEYKQYDKKDDLLQTLNVLLEKGFNPIQSPRSCLRQESDRRYLVRNCTDLSLEEMLNMVYQKALGKPSPNLEAERCCLILQNIFSNSPYLREIENLCYALLKRINRWKADLEKIQAARSELAESEAKAKHSEKLRQLRDAYDAWKKITLEEEVDEKKIFSTLMQIASLEKDIREILTPAMKARHTLMGFTHPQLEDRKKLAILIAKAVEEELWLTRFADYFAQQAAQAKEEESIRKLLLVHEFLRGLIGNSLPGTVESAALELREALDNLHDFDWGED